MRDFLTKLLIQVFMVFFIFCLALLTSVVVGIPIAVIFYILQRYNILSGFDYVLLFLCLWSFFSMLLTILYLLPRGKKE